MKHMCFHISVLDTGIVSRVVPRTKSLGEARYDTGTEMCFPGSSVMGGRTGKCVFSQQGYGTYVCF